MPMSRAMQKVQQARALLALPPDEGHPEQIPAGLERTDTDQKAQGLCQRSPSGRIRSASRGPQLPGS
jgi:hypothetical protein